MAGIKIVDLPAVGRDLAATDLFEMSLVGGTGSRKITGQEIMNASKLSVNNTPVINGTSGRIFFQDAANVLQQSANLFWNNTSGRLGLNTSTPSATLEVNGTTTLQDTITAYSRMDMYGTLYMNNNITSLSGNIWLSNGYAIGEYSTGNNRIEFYTTKLSLITNGNDVMTLFNSGNVAINTTTDAGFRLDVNGTARVVGPTLAVGDWTQRSTSVYVRALTGGSENRGFFIGYGASNDGNGGSFTYQPTGNVLNIRSPYNSGTIALSFEGNTNSTQFHNQSGAVISKFFSNTGNWGLGTTTDEGYRLDVNGISRVKGNLQLTTANPTINMQVGDNTQVVSLNMNATDGAARGGLITNINTGEVRLLASFGGYFLTFFSNNTERMRIPTTGNLLINTTTDAGFRLDVNGTARVQGRLTIGTTSTTGEVFSTANTTLSIGGGQITNAITFSQINDGKIPTNNAESSLALMTISQNNTGGGNNFGNVIRMAGSVTNTVNTNTFNNIQTNTIINTTGGTTTYRGFYHNPTLTSMTGVTHYAIHTTSGRVRLEGLPTSPTGLSAGDLWNNGGVINIV